jgi:dTDP-4-dehydrorhamnose 3,5-epimerase
MAPEPIVPRFEVASTLLDGLLVITRQQLSDDRGFLSRLFCADEIAADGRRLPVAQVNHTLTRRRGTVRGMHFQHPPHAETKYVSCLQGEIFDVAVDLRRGSPTFLHWHGEILSRDNLRALLIPEGFAHGYQTLTDGCELLYLHSVAHHAAAEGALQAQDPRLAIAWPLPITDMSDRDRRHPVLTAAFAGLEL